MRKTELIENLEFNWQIETLGLPGEIWDDDKVESQLKNLNSFIFVYDNLINQALAKSSASDEIIEKYTNAVKSLKNINDFLLNSESFKITDYGSSLHFDADTDEDEILEALNKEASNSAKAFYDFLLNLVDQQTKLVPYLKTKFQDNQMLAGFNNLDVVKLWLMNIAKNTNIAKNGINLKQSNQQTKSKQSSNKNSSKIKI